MAEPSDGVESETATVPDVDQRPLLQLVGTWRWAPWAVGAMVVLRFVAVAGLRAYIYFDSGEYDRLDFTGRWRRPWATPLLYWLVPGGLNRIVVVQALLGALTWSILALSAAAWCRSTVVRISLAVAILSLGASTSVTNWDAAKLSESLALSLTALVVAAWLNFVRRPLPGTALLVIAATFPWLFVRQSLMPTAGMVALVSIGAVVVVWRRGGPAKTLAGLAVALVLLVGLASFSYARNQEVVRENLTVIVANRIAPDASRLAWFRAHGMPTPASGDLGRDALRSDPAFARWVRHAARTTYARYLLTHPWYIATEPLDDMVAQRRSYGDEAVVQPTMLSPADAYGPSRPVIPEIVEQALFQPGGTGGVIAALVAVLGWTVARRRRRELRWVVPMMMIAISLTSLVIAWHGATPELGRLAIIGAVVLRLGLLLQVAGLADQELLARRIGVVDPVGSG